MEELDLFPEDLETSTQIMFVNFGLEESAYCLPLLKQLREKGISSELYPTLDKMKKQMNYANNKGVQFVVLVGEDEIKSGSLTVKDMITGEQSKLSISELIKKIS